MRQGDAIAQREVLADHEHSGPVALAASRSRLAG
jgi:hypothetical protein